MSEGSVIPKAGAVGKKFRNQPIRQVMGSHIPAVATKTIIKRKAKLRPTPNFS